MEELAIRLHRIAPAGNTSDTHVPGKERRKYVRWISKNTECMKKVEIQIQNTS